MDSFEVVYGCRSSADDASIQRIRFSGGVYTESPQSMIGYAVLTGMIIEMNN